MTTCYASGCTWSQIARLCLRPTRHVVAKVCHTTGPIQHEYGTPNYGRGLSIIFRHEQQRALVASLKSLQRTRRGVSAEKGDPPARRTSTTAPRWPSGTLAAPSTLAIPTCPRERRGRGLAVNDCAGPAHRTYRGPSRPNRRWWTHVPDGPRGG